MNVATRCACNRPVLEFLWVVKGIWYCSQACGSLAATRIKTDNLQPQSQARR